MNKECFKVYLLEKLVDDLGKPIEKRLVFSEVTVHPEYEVNIDLNLEKNDINAWTLIFNFMHVRKLVEGYRIPAVFLHHRSTKLHVCTELDGNRNFNLISIEEDKCNQIKNNTVNICNI